ncbi:hypothetical protein GCM10010510_43540 [Streptomyces anandii JCM 4720]|nr:hypothetical protein GCM10010510_43540 [Streptomyces anandii JCM 4720]
MAGQLADEGCRCLLTGDMGIANTTASAALVAVFTGARPDDVTGHGAGVDEETRRHKADVVRRALELHRPQPQDPVGALAAVGGLEHAALAGFVLGAAARRIPVILDGVIASSAALVAAALSPDAVVACVAGHRSVEPGHTVALRHLGLEPLVDLGLRLGEGTGALLALPLLQSAARTLRDMATFDAAGVSHKPLRPLNRVPRPAGRGTSRHVVASGLPPGGVRLAARGGFLPLCAFGPAVAPGVGRGGLRVPGVGPTGWHVRPGGCRVPGRWLVVPQWVTVKLSRMAVASDWSPSVFTRSAAASGVTRPQARRT